VIVHLLRSPSEGVASMMRRGPVLVVAIIITLFVLLVHLPETASGLAGQPTGKTDETSHPENRWIKQSPREGAAVPRFSWEGSGSFDPYSRRWIHWGGHDGIPQEFHLFCFDLNTGVWEQKFPNTSPPGVCCVDGANVFDLANQRFVRFPGASLGH